MSFSVISKDTEKHLILHDCDCNHLYFKDGSLTMEMEWMEVLASHPNNPFSQAHQSGEGKIVFYNPKLCVGNLTLRDDKSIAINSLVEIDYRDFETLDFEIEQSNIGRHLKLFGVLMSSKKISFVNLEIDYENADVMWNKLNDVSWFENFNMSTPSL